MRIMLMKKFFNKKTIAITIAIVLVIVAIVTIAAIILHFAPAPKHTHHWELFDESELGEKFLCEGCGMFVNLPTGSTECEHKNLKDVVDTNSCIFVTCRDCGYSVQAPHNFNKNNVCTVCGTESCEHDFYTAHTSKNHYDICLVCGYKTADEKHEWHYFYDGPVHYLECENCDYIAENEPHTLKGNKCTKCNYVDCDHINGFYMVDLDYHIYNCKDCNYINEDIHTFVDGKCIECGQSIATYYGLLTDVWKTHGSFEAELLVNNEYLCFECSVELRDLNEGSFIKVIVEDNEIIKYELILDYETYEHIEDSDDSFSLKNLVCDQLITKMENPQVFEDITIEEISIDKDGYGFIFFENGNFIEHANWVIIDLEDSEYLELDFLDKGDWVLFYEINRTAYIFYIG